MVLILFPSNKSETLPLATRYNITFVGLSPDGNLAILIDEGIYFVLTGVEDKYNQEGEFFLNTDIKLRNCIRFRLIKLYFSRMLGL